MHDAIRRTLARPLVGLWLTFSPHSWRRHLLARDSPHVWAPGSDPDRILLVGDGAGVGRGVVTHDLGLPGFLARSLSSRTGRAAEVDVAIEDDMTVLGCLEAIARRDLERYDIVVLSVGAREALELMSSREWQLAVREVVGAIRQKVPRGRKVFLMAIPQFGINPHFPRALANIVDFQVGVMNTITERAASERLGIIYVPESSEQMYELEGPLHYARWAEAIAERIYRHLDPARPRAVDTAREDEQARQLALQRFESLLDDAPDPVLDHLADDARRLFGTALAAVTFIGAETQQIRAASGFEPFPVARDRAMCDVTIRRKSTFVIEDASRDPRYEAYPAVADLDVRFYAGYPLESPDGHRIGALCVMDTEPRRFSSADESMLRSVAVRVQDHLFERAGLTGAPL